MERENPSKANMASLRERAERKLRERAARLHGLPATAVNRLIHELGTYMIELEMQNEELKKAQEEIEGFRRKYVDFYEFAPVGYLTLDRSGMIIEANHTAGALLDRPKRSLLSNPFSSYIALQDAPVFKDHVREVFEKRSRRSCEVRLKKKGGGHIHVELQSIAGEENSGQPLHMYTAFIDSTERKKVEQELLECKRELDTKSLHIEEVNTALKVLLKQRDEDKAEMGKSVIANMRELVIPCIEQLKKARLDPKETACVNRLESHLLDIISPFALRLSAKCLELTRTEIQIASFIKEGKSSKEIAGILNRSTGTVEFHRNNIRMKLGLTNTRTGLRAYLLSLA
ncbi:MAG TPA: LuxR C-terminal-related transcriptional regulator [Dissulfurispiraceae bacterium]